MNLPGPTASPVSSAEYARAMLNILEDSAAEQARLADTQRAFLNILDDFAGEKDHLEAAQKAVLNILDDFAGEKARLEQTQKATMNLLEDFDEEKRKVAAANEDLRREIAERRLAENALMEKSLALARSNDDLEQFAYVASHDLQEPLRMVSNYVQLLATRYQGRMDDKADRYIGYAVEGAKRMQALIAGLLEYSRVGQEMQPTRSSAETALKEALRNLEPALEECRAVVTIDPLPEVMADPEQLIQVFQNLVSNALKFRSAGRRPEIRVTATRQPAGWVFAVRDNGIGIDARYADRIFAIFQRLHTRAEYAGTGVGLSICKKVVERLGGRIWVESTPGAGSTFSFTLPPADAS